MVIINGYYHHYQGVSELIFNFFLGLMLSKDYVCFLNDVLINEDEIDELEVEEGTKNH